jgi:type IV secretory pathway ATPase VirB11/archaellum biosynthesis ATPase
MSSPPLLGRDHKLDQVDNRLREVVKRGNVGLRSGSTGIGKTSLLNAAGQTGSPQ